MSDTDQKIVYNGVEYESIEEMPTYARALYEGQIGAAAGGGLERSTGRRPDYGSHSRPTAPEPSFSARSLLIGLVIAALAYVIAIVLQKG